MAKTSKKPTAAARKPADAKRAPAKKASAKSPGKTPSPKPAAKGGKAKPAAKASAKPSKPVAKPAPVAKSAAPVKSSKSAPVAKAATPTKSSKSAPVAKPVVKKSAVPPKAVVPAPAPVAAKPVAAPAQPVKPAVPAKPLSKAAARRAQQLADQPTRVEIRFDKPFEPKNTNGKKLKKKSRPAPPPEPVDPVAQVMATVKPGKNGAGLTPKQLEFFRDMLLAKRRELVGDMYSMEREALQRSGENLSNLPMHMADQGTDNYEQEFTLGLMEKDRQLLREINSALAKIVDGRYGLCEGTGKPISTARLEVQPWAKFSIEHARKLEQRVGFR
ncbi:MAG TPA: TraR/DksA C4-type zinc finger protein [Tepidisphaeraceae bacterium]|nr:TraR/DksA C4-type zinc finger protein [Tepidisphaeraceae bacterium]